MWSRVVEAMLGIWLILSPFIFHHPADQWRWWANDFATGTLTMILALSSYYPPCRHCHLGTIAVALWLIGSAYFSPIDPLPPALQNNMVLGLLLAMFAIIPNHASRPPRDIVNFERF